MEAKLRGHTETIGERMERALDALLPLPAVPYDPERQAHDPRELAVAGPLPHQLSS